MAAKLSEILRLRPELTRTAEFDDWLATAEQHWVGHVRTTRYDGRGWFVLDTLAGTPPAALREGAIEHDGRWLAPLTAQAAAALAELRDAAAQPRRPPLRSRRSSTASSRRPRG